MQPQSQHPKIRNNPLSPLEQLLADKANIEAMCRKQEKKLGEDFAYMRDHAPGLFLSGISSLLFSSGKSGEKTNPVATGKGKRNELTTPFAASEYLAIIKTLLPTAWRIAQPLLLTWCINKTKSLIFGLCSGGKKPSSRG
ncbi:MAG: hypothetical protein LBF85_03885 [Tannerella sp.]|jgi:metal-dependent amidase/aminoacylase/carboxypeptidase family protein|nr:hypothetical protein [Tannerella sp.]